MQVLSWKTKSTPSTTISNTEDYTQSNSSANQTIIHDVEEDYIEYEGYREFENDSDYQDYLDYLEYSDRSNYEDNEDSEEEEGYINRDLLGRRIC
jgi:hypothetical protein